MHRKSVRKKQKKILLSMFGLFLLITSATLIYGTMLHKGNVQSKKVELKKEVTVQTKTAESKMNEEISTSSEEQEKDAVHPWNEPSEKEYPVIQNPQNLSVKVSIPDQRVYIRENGKTIYTMVCSTGDSAAGTPTPKGSFVIEPERGDKFYWAEDNDWAYNWVSFSGHGIYLFHSVLMWNEHEVEEKGAVRLGQEASHGCIRLPLPDSKWFYETITTGTPVEIV